VHAAADGIALGAASLTDKAEIEFIIFLAIMLHKAPAAFGLTSFLLHEVRWLLYKHDVKFSPLFLVLTCFDSSNFNPLHLLLLLIQLGVSLN
jgi:zinc transporter 9